MRTTSGMRVALGLIGALVVAGPAPARAETAASDPRAVAIADQVMVAMGGKDAWEKLPGLRWSFDVTVNDTLRSSRREAWDRKTDWYRVEGKTRAGQPFCFMRSLRSDEGRAWMDGKSIEGDSLQKLLKRAKSLWINDTYWLLMPYKLRDPGVTLQYAGDTTVAGATYDRVALSFENVGETPGDHYWVWVNRGNHRVERWDMVLQSDQPPPKSYTWEGWEQHGGLWFATAHRQPPAVVYTRNLEIVSKFGDQEFRAP